MRFLIFFLLLCGCAPDCMVISDACEIQFWPVGETSFNLEEEGYTDEGYCFHQKFLCTGQRRFQGVDADGVQRDYWLLGFDEDGNELFNEQFEVWQDSMDLLEDYPFVDWINEDTGTTPWTAGANPTITKPIGGASDGLSIPVSGFVAGTYNIDYDFTRTGGGILSGSFLQIRFLKEGSSVGTGSVDISGTSPIQGTETITLSDVPDKLSLRVTNPAVAGNSTLTITMNEDLVCTSYFGPVKYSLAMTPSDESMCDKKVQFKIYTGTEVSEEEGHEGELDITHEDSEELFYSDFIDFVSAWANSPGTGRVDIQYRSIQNFAGLMYDSESPYFQIQLEGRFRKERKITQQKAIELTEIVLNTAASVKKQIKLTIDDVPDYMHTKILLILAHSASGSVLVNGEEISIEENYEEGERPESYPMTPADIWLTVKNYYKHNVI